MTTEQRAAYIAMIGAAQEALHDRQREALAAFKQHRSRLRLQAELLTAIREYQSQIGLR